MRTLRVARIALAASALASLALGALACSIGGDAIDDAHGRILASPPNRDLACAPERQRCAVDFTWSGAAEASVELRGSWPTATSASAWTAGQGEPMTSFGSQFRRTLLVTAGSTVEYKYCIDPDARGECARWETDPTRPTSGTYGNNVLANVQCETPVCLPESVPSTATAATVTPAGPLRFIAVGDTGEQGMNSVTAAMADKCRAEGCDFVLLLGDNIYPNGADSPTDPAFRGAFEDHFRPVNVPFEVALGNHDYGGNGAGDEDARAQNEVDYTAHSKRWRMPSRYYRFTAAAGNVDFFALDTNAQMYSHDAQQKADVKAWLAESKAPWKIAFGHHPYVSNGPHGNAGDYDGLPDLPVWNGAEVKAFAEEVYCGTANLYLSGHDHSRQWLTDTCSGTALAVAGAGAMSTSLPGPNPTQFQSLDLGFLYLVIDGDILTAQFVDGAGRADFTTTLTRPH